MIGLEPGPYTMRELIQMAEGRWASTAQTLVMLAETNRDKKRRPQPFAEKDFPCPLIDLSKHTAKRGRSIVNNVRSLKSLVPRHGK